MQSFDVSILNDSRIRDQLSGVIKDVSNKRTIIESSQTAISEALAAVAEETKIPKSIINKLAMMYHKDSLQDEVDRVETLQEAYGKIFTS